MADCMYYVYKFYGLFFYSCYKLVDRQLSQNLSYMIETKLY